MTYDEAKKHLAAKEAVSDDGGLYNLGWYLSWYPAYDSATLDGGFTAKDLLAIAIYMKGEDDKIWSKDP